MPPGIYKRKSPVQEKLARMKDIILEDALRRGSYNNQKSQIEDLRNYIKENGITKAEVVSTVLSLFKEWWNAHSKRRY